MHRILRSIYNYYLNMSKILKMEYHPIGTEPPSKHGNDFRSILHKYREMCAILTRDRFPCLEGGRGGKSAVTWLLGSKKVMNLKESFDKMLLTRFCANFVKCSRDFFTQCMQMHSS